MRKAVNENPRVQIAVIGVMLLAAAILLMRVMKKDEPVVDPNTATVSASVSGPQGDVSLNAEIPLDAAAASDPASALGGSTSAITDPTVTPEALKPGPGLPKPLADAYQAGDAIVLLIVREGAADDRLVRSSVEALRGRPNVTVFVVPADKIANYSRITQPVDVSRVPALLVVRPKRLSGKTPQATVSYGFRSSASVLQALQDALYTGKTDVPYYPG
jgi:hypothetical protein